MIYRIPETLGHGYWRRDTNSQAGTIARDFLVGEYEILKLAHIRSTALHDLRMFLDTAKDATVSVARGPAGELLVIAEGRNEMLMITGRTAVVLRGYLDAQLVTMQDRFDMTQRLHAM